MIQAILVIAVLGILAAIGQIGFAIWMGMAVAVVLVIKRGVASYEASKSQEEIVE
ncbi:hypothetical protein SEPL_002 [Salmonella phage SE_PL]|uniref:hypothetical protein n=1 Tax=Salmonella enterica TaxID=28901 RepID=UPI000FDF7792|nr:hypothetical protein CPT_Munch_427 [Salmonella phage Munch]EHX8550654.1 hypothetical protein [Salmonella enterica]MCP0435561.1 hypothetical protein [Salmonella enterica subsp. enterica serovar Mbandaka]QCW19130.1 hypothetical protein 7t3_0615 [Salmonella phage 7t3]QIG62615.1 hypothetical protein SEPL_002 [Salmonella phage SE_PL]WNV47522.1 hypothetical protein [Klebsiella phage fENko-Kae01]